MRVSREKWTGELYAELYDLILIHNEETASTLGPVEPMLEFYFMLANQEALECIIARNDEGEAIGYMLCLITYNHHHRSVLVGSQDIFFVREDYRKGSLGTKIIKKAEEVLIARGCQIISMFYSESMDLKNYYEHLGYTPMEHTVYKKVGD